MPPSRCLLLPVLLLVFTILTPPVVRGFPQNEQDLALKQNGNDRDWLDWLWSLTGLTTTTPKPILKPPKDCRKCECGKANKGTRIVGGEETEINEYPWMALLLYNKQFYCGGTLINDRYVMTAGHCVKSFNHSKIVVRLLEHNRDQTSESQTIDRQVERVVLHPHYSTITYDSDMALLKLTEKVEFVDKLRPACLATRGKSFSGMDGTVTGWGATQEGGSVANSLLEVTVPIMSNMKCRETEYKDRITDNMLCAGYSDGKKDSCQGDSGGPLHIYNATTKHYDVVGVVSWGEGCAQENKPGVYTRVNRYITWIKSNTADACYC